VTEPLQGFLYPMPDSLLPVIDWLTRNGQHVMARVVIDCRAGWLADRQEAGLTDAFRLVLPESQYRDFVFVSGSASLKFGAVPACEHGYSDGSCSVKGCRHYTPAWDPPKDDEA